MALTYREKEQRRVTRAVGKEEKPRCLRELDALTLKIGTSRYSILVALYGEKAAAWKLNDFAIDSCTSKLK